MHDVTDRRALEQFPIGSPFPIHLQ